MALKSFNLNNVTVKEFVNEVYNLERNDFIFFYKFVLRNHLLIVEVDFHDNIIRLYGMTKNDSGKYIG